jgi:hypothetical protein
MYEIIEEKSTFDMLEHLISHKILSQPIYYLQARVFIFRMYLKNSR